MLKRGPYTTLLQLAQVPKQDWGSSPNMRIQLYHDTKSAEVVAYQHRSRFHGAYEYPNKRMRARDERATQPVPWRIFVPVFGRGHEFPTTLNLPMVEASSNAFGEDSGDKAQ